MPTWFYSDLNKTINILFIQSERATRATKDAIDLIKSNTEQRQNKIVAFV